MKAVITGATGLLGGNLARELIARDVEVVATRRPSSRIDHLGDAAIMWMEAGLDSHERLAGVFAGADVVFHCAAQVSTLRKASPSMIRANVDSTRHVIDAVRAAGVPRLVHCSSTVACALSTDGKPVTEDRPWNFDTFGLADGYTITKRKSEELVAEAARAGLDAVVVNPGYMFGPYDARPSSGRLIVDVVKGKVPGHTDGRNCFADVRDVACGMIGAWQRGRSGERYILGGHNLSYREIMHTIAEIAGVRPPRFAVPRPIASALGWFGEAVQAVSKREAFINITRVRYGYCRDFIFSSDKAMRELDYQIRPIEESIADAIDWFREHGMI